jgi:hypothetical protein
MVKRRLAKEWSLRKQRDIWQENGRIFRDSARRRFQGSASASDEWGDHNGLTCASRGAVPRKSGALSGKSSAVLRQGDEISRSLLMSQTTLGPHPCLKSMSMVITHLLQFASDWAWSGA